MDPCKNLSAEKERLEGKVTQCSFKAQWLEKCRKLKKQTQRRKILSYELYMLLCVHVKGEENPKEKKGFTMPLTSDSNVCETLLKTWEKWHSNLLILLQYILSFWRKITSLLVTLYDKFAKNKKLTSELNKKLSCLNKIRIIWI